jgi:hypothetical protein
MKVLCVSPNGLDIRVGGAVCSVKPGETIDVPADVAGTPPDPRIDVAMLELRAAVAAIDHHRAVALREEIAGLDFGSGLLAQSDVWAPAKAVKPAPTTKDGV